MNKPDLMHSDCRITRIFELFRKFATVDYIGEPISQLEHALQSAFLAKKAQASDAAVVAALLHDVGHLCAPEDSPQMNGLGVLHHEEIGANWLSELGFSDEVISLVKGHVQAKRYLVYHNKRYFDQLSEASRGTLELQGGPMNDEEAKEFESDPLFKIKLCVRRWDEHAKVKGMLVPPLEEYRTLLAKYLN